MNVGNIHNCFGCGVCAITCSKKLIDIRLNSDGFYEPFIERKAECTNCGLCYNVCSFVHDDIALHSPVLGSYAAWSNDGDVRRKCSSGGIAFELGRLIIGEGNKVCGVRYNVDKNQVEHYIASTLEELYQSCGSKYLQSYTVDAFGAINRKEKYLVIGTPCQIDSFRRYIQRFRCEKNFILVDFFCHGVPSKLMWNKYKDYIEENLGKITNVAWRSKDEGWHDSWNMNIDVELFDDIPLDIYNSYELLKKSDKVSITSRWTQGDMFYRLFLSDSCLGKACYNNCRFKWDKSSADMRIGDLWGNAYRNEEKGVSAVVTFTKIGEWILHSCNCVCKEHSFDIVSEGQMKDNPSQSRLYYRVMKGLHTQNDILSIHKEYIRERNIKRLINRFLHPIQSMFNLLKRLV